MEKRIIKRKKLVLKKQIKEWLLIHVFCFTLYLSMFAWLFDSRKYGFIFAFGFMLFAVGIEILVKIFKEISKNLLTKLAK